MSMPHTPKLISAASIPSALEKAKRYRLLNDPAPAASICLDILAIDEANQDALAMLLLAITDQLLDGSGAGRMKEAKGYLARITSAYQRAYFAGLVVEKQGRGALQRGMGGAFAYTCLREAMEHYERANELKEPGNDEAILRWNCCVRTIQEHGLRPRQQTTEQLLE